MSLSDVLTENKAMPFWIFIPSTDGWARVRSIIMSSWGWTEGSLQYPRDFEKHIALFEKQADSD